MPCSWLPSTWLAGWPCANAEFRRPWRPRPSCACPDRRLGCAAVHGPVCRARGCRPPGWRVGLARTPNFDGPGGLGPAVLALIGDSAALLFMVLYAVLVVAVHLVGGLALRERRISTALAASAQLGL